MAAVQLNGIFKRYGDTQVVHGIDLHIDDGEFVVLVGPSGCGKSTLMRMVAGLEEISGGELTIGGMRANGLPPQQRNISMVFQSYALYPHLSVYENIAFGPRVRKEAVDSFKPRIEAAAKMLNLGGYLDRLPRALSGGQRQRVAMGRAVVREPALFLFDEPLSNLDAKLRVQMRTEIKALHQRLKNTVIYVTHDQIEAMTMADRIVVMNAGRIEQIGSPLDLYDRPANKFVAGFLGSPSMNFAEGTLTGGALGATLRIAEGATVNLPRLKAPIAEDTEVIFGVRPEHIQISTNPDGVSMEVEVIEPTGAETHFYGKVNGSTWCITTRERATLRPDQRVRLQFAPEHIHLFNLRTGSRIE
ncbi:ABC transporter ATP-binding protein [Burkholderia oklahomensis]|uniref:ABC transporter family protein n=1 Tax=Burkholderia oklahomensis TaxID=342113 RepID=A0AAI8B4J0_9BURK|nr:sn-glycerol-3-phosphate ABC transporter ATP-binding protein UgpC [Burkholderia oklahomensis]AIO65364.1 ABC transporter family protein [Burkholderia oklahomensis]AJX31575.1 ABC transporter family protein [Burkholderia oklahomensis C6786]AOI43249.1 ABC transporter [Burkholderia oklahomensis EO147]AOI46822.1 ABC transporter [Burkholderia oklahomensis C6786]KUY47529.1 ABC transporter [Burkholderia oklahomensis EO147]